MCVCVQHDSHDEYDFFSAVFIHIEFHLHKIYFHRIGTLEKSIDVLVERKGREKEKAFSYYVRFKPAHRTILADGISYITSKHVSCYKIIFIFIDEMEKITCFSVNMRIFPQKELLIIHFDV